ncbi:MAG: hypothetical protein GXO78_14040 [Calditrichaeota bacterium]|nr:hypothetical protein [Calditrichota bacterium]
MLIFLGFIRPIRGFMHDFGLSPTFTCLKNAPTHQPLLIATFSDKGEFLALAAVSWDNPFTHEIDGIHPLDSCDLSAVNHRASGHATQWCFPGSCRLAMQSGDSILPSSVPAEYLIS